MNWLEYYDFFDLLSLEQVNLFATPREVSEAIESYNKALSLLKSDQPDLDQAARLLAVISSDYPMFPEAMHVYAILLAADKKYQAANELLKKVALLDISQDQANMLTEQRVVLDRELALAESRARDKEQQNRADESAKKNFSLANVLEKAGHSKYSSHIDQADINKINKMLGNEDPSDLSGEIAQEEKQDTIHFTLKVLALAILTFLIFYFGIRPAIIKSRGGDLQVQKQLTWLEKELAKGAGREPALEDLYDRYREKFDPEEGKVVKPSKGGDQGGKTGASETGLSADSETQKASDRRGGETITLAGPDSADGDQSPSLSIKNSDGE